MSQQVALVTGSATGAGRAIALRFARRGFAVAVNYSRSEAEANETFAQVEALGVPAILCKATVGDDAQVRAMVERCRVELGGLDVLVNNAGTTHFIPHTELEAVTDAAWDEIFQVNLKGGVLRQPGRDAAAEGTQGQHRQRVFRRGPAGARQLDPLLGQQGGDELHDAVAGPCLRAGRARQRGRPRPDPDALARWSRGARRQGDRPDADAAARPRPTTSPTSSSSWPCGTGLMTGQVVVVDGGRTM